MLIELIKKPRSTQHSVHLQGKLCFYLFKRTKDNVPKYDCSLNISSIVSSEPIEVFFGANGLLISGSSGEQLWPIVDMVLPIELLTYGNEKP